MWNTYLLLKHCSKVFVLCYFELSTRYYSATILQMSGVRNDRLAIWLAGLTTLTNFLFTLLGVWLVERVGRRKLTLGSIIGKSKAKMWLHTWEKKTKPWRHSNPPLCFLFFFFEQARASVWVCWLPASCCLPSTVLRSPSIQQTVQSPTPTASNTSEFLTFLWKWEHAGSVQNAIFNFFSQFFQLFTKCTIGQTGLSTPASILSIHQYNSVHIKPQDGVTNPRGLGLRAAT